jgi:hypothetical protein
MAAGHRIQTAIALLISADADYQAAAPKHLRVGVDTSKSDMKGLADLLIEKGVFTKDEYIAAITVACEEEADGYEKKVQAFMSNRNIITR